MGVSGTHLDSLMKLMRSHRLFGPSESMTAVSKGVSYSAKYIHGGLCRKRAVPPDVHGKERSILLTAIEKVRCDCWGC